MIINCKQHDIMWLVNMNIAQCILLVSFEIVTVNNRYPIIILTKFKYLMIFFFDFSHWLLSIYMLNTITNIKRRRLIDYLQTFVHLNIPLLVCNMWLSVLWVHLTKPYSRKRLHHDYIRTFKCNYFLLFAIISPQKK